MIDSYTVGQRISPSDFANEWYCPPARYSYAEVESIDDEVISLRMENPHTGISDSMQLTRAEMGEALGWASRGYMNGLQGPASDSAQKHIEIQQEELDTDTDSGATQDSGTMRQGPQSPGPRRKDGVNPLLGN